MLIKHFFNVSVGQINTLIRYKLRVIIIVFAGKYLSLRVQLGLIRKWKNCPGLNCALGLSFLTKKKCSRNLCLKLIGKVQLHCLDIGRDTDDWKVVLVSAKYLLSAAAFAGKSRLRMRWVFSVNAASKPSFLESQMLS